MMKHDMKRKYVSVIRVGNVRNARVFILGLVHLVLYGNTVVYIYNVYVWSYFSHFPLNRIQEVIFGIIRI